MPERLGCEAPPTKLPDGTSTTCCEPGRRWMAEKDGKQGDIVRCDKHAAALRRRGYEVHLAGKAPKDRPPWDMTSTNSLEAAANYVRKNSGALLVFVMRASDAVLVVEKGILRKTFRACWRLACQERSSACISHVPHEGGRDAKTRRAACRPHVVDTRCAGRYAWRLAATGTAG